MSISLIGMINTPTQPNIVALGTLNSGLRVSGTSTFSSMFSSSIFTLASTYGLFVRSNPIKIGPNSGLSNQNSGAIAIGYSAGNNRQLSNAIAIGFQAGATNQGMNSISIGYQAGQTNQGSGSIAIGYLAGSQQGVNSVVISAKGTVVTGGTTGAIYIAPVRQLTQSNYLGYNAVTDELTYFTTALSSVFERYRISLTASQTGNDNILVKWDGNTQGSITGMTFDVTTGFFSFNTPGSYFFYFNAKFNNATAAMEKSIYFPNSKSAGQSISTLDFFNYQYGLGNFMGTLAVCANNFTISLTEQDLPCTFGTAWYNQGGISSYAQLEGTSTSPTNPTSLAITRISY